MRLVDSIGGGSEPYSRADFIASDICSDSLPVTHNLETWHGGMEITVPAGDSVDTYLKGAYLKYLIAQSLLGRG
jgi:hypothetical protein